MALIGLVTTEGLSYAATARANQGWFIYPTKFSVSDTAGTFDISRTLDDINPSWFTGLISTYNKINALTIELVGTIPINSNSGVNSTIAECYYYCETQSFNISCNTTTNEISFTDANAPDFLALLSNGDRVTVRIKKDSGGSMPNPLLEAQTYFVRKSGSIVTLFNSKADALANTNVIDLTTTGSELVMQKEFLYAIAQFTTPIPYIANSGNYTLRPSLVTANTADPNLFQFFYTQATDVNNHNLNPEAHPLIQEALNKAGVFVQLSEHDYVGQSFDEIPVFESGANTENTIVYVKANGKYEKALANGTISEINTIGVVKDGIVKTLQGFFNIGTHGFSIGSLVYLSDTVAGTFTTTATTCKLGLVVSATTVYLDKPLAVQVSASGVVNFTDLGDVPSAYTGNGLKFLRVNTGESGLEFVTIPDATETQKGLIEIATEAETLAGVDTSRAVVPATLQAFLTNNSFNSSGSLVMPTISYRNFGSSRIDIIDDLTAITTYKYRIFTIEYDSTNLFRIRYDETSMKSVTVTLTSYTSYGGSVARIKPDAPFKYYLGYNDSISSTDAYQYMDNIKVVNIQNQNLLFANVYGKLEIFNIEDSNGALITPTQTGLGSITFTAPNWCVAFEVYGNALYALKSDRTIAVYDLTSLSSPASVMSNIPSFAPTDYNTTPIYCHNGYMYILSGTSILVYNISNPLSPTYVSTMSSMFTTTTNTANNHLVFVDKYCFLVDFVSSEQRIKNSIKVYDVSNPTSWVLVKTISGNYTTVVKSYLQILLISKPKIEGCTFEIFDLNTMSILGKNNFHSGIAYLFSGHLNKIQINESFPYLLSNRTARRTIDLSYLISYIEGSTISGSTGSGYLTFSGDTSVNNIAISSGYNRNFYTVHDTSISDVQWDDSLNDWSVYTTNTIVPDLGVKTGFCDFNTLYVFNHTVSKLYIFSVLQSSSSPYVSLLSNTSISKNTNYVYLSSGHAVFTNSTQVDIYEVFNKTSISQIRSNLDLTEGQPIVGIKSFEKYLYVWTKSKLYVYDTTDISTFTTPTYSKYILNIVDLDFDPRGWLYIATSGDVSIYSQNLNFINFVKSGSIGSIRVFGNILSTSSMGEEIGNTDYYLVRSINDITQISLSFNSAGTGIYTNSTLSTKCWFYVDSAIYRTSKHSIGSYFTIQSSFLSI